MKYTSEGAFVAQIGKAGLSNVYPRPLLVADDLAVDAGGNIWVADWDASHVLKFDSSLKYVSELGQAWNRGQDNARFNYPAAIAFDAAGRIYVSDGAPEWDYNGGNHRIQVFNASGSYLTTIGVAGQPGSDVDHFRGPKQIAIVGDLLYVADSGNHRVQILNIANPLTPIYVATIGVTGQSGSDNADLNNPSGVALDASYIYVADRWNSRIQIFDRATRTYVATIGGSWGTGNTQFKEPTDVAVDAAGNIYVADAENQRVQQFNAGRAYVRTYGTTGVPYLTDLSHFYEPSGAALGSDGSSLCDRKPWAPPDEAERRRDATMGCR